jgi:FKBP-type peptidyl-prolyl cis-trans isomerase FkpA
MKKIGVFSLIVVILFTACKADNGCKNVSPSVEESQITSYAAANSISAVKHGTGMYYEIISQGSGPTPTITSTVTITYTGKRLDGSVFDQSTAPVSYKLNDFIEGWKVGLPLIQKGGHIKLIIPSSMAYGCNGYPPVIGGNNVLFFDIQLIDVQ